ncbi:MAG: hypothetical protein AB1416_09490 [Actinomycetota bacterium]
MAVDRKRSLFDRLAADVIVVPECSRASRFSQELGVAFAWRGTYAQKGLGVFALNGWRLEPAEERVRIPWVMPLHLLDREGEEAALLLATWTVRRNGDPSYDEQVAAVIAEWANEIRTGKVILAGDFNCSAQTAASSRHMENVAELHRLGSVSAYHSYYDCAHGAESSMTLRWVGPGAEERWFHCDFVFVSAALASGVAHVEVGAPAEWIGPGRSDHCPVVVHLDAPAAADVRRSETSEPGSPPDS